MSRALILAIAAFAAPALSGEVNLCERVLRSEPVVELPASISALDRSTFKFFDPDVNRSSGAFDPKYYFNAWVDEDHLLTLDVFSRDGKLVSDRIFASKMFDRMMTHFQMQGTEIRSIQGMWLDGTNLEMLNRFTAEGEDLIQAASKTWTGLQTGRYGYTKVDVVDFEGGPGAYRNVIVRFSRP
ncbi:MAG: hypothetical protein JST04_04215 [Bdellovibrionales bacterium]|nr:hypothetical protein [Bdellovibrionales bacterium]